MNLPRPRSLAGQLFALQAMVLVMAVGLCATFAYLGAGGQAEEAARRQTAGTAGSVAAAPSVREAIRSSDPTALLQPYAEQVRKNTGVAFVTIMNPRGIRWTHPDPRLIGGRFSGHIESAQKGETSYEIHSGSFGPSVRVVMPIFDGTTIVGLVSAGITVQRINDQVWQQLVSLAGTALAVLAVCGLAMSLLAVRLRRQTHSMPAAELGQMYAYQQATLHALREGLLILDAQGRITLINDGGRQLLGLGPEAGSEGVIGRRIDELGLPVPLTDAMMLAQPRVEEVHLTGERVLVVNTAPVLSGARRGTVVTLRDHTELRLLSRELRSVQGFAEALRSQAHEAANRMHTVVSLIELGRAEEAVRFATVELALTGELTDQIAEVIAEPVLAALLLSKAAQADQLGVEFALAPDSRVEEGSLPEDSLSSGDLVTVLGNLIDNALDAAVQGTACRGSRLHPSAPGGDGLAPQRRPRVTVTVRADAAELLISVCDTGPGLDTTALEEIFRRGWSTKSPVRSADHESPESGRGLGLALVRQATRRNRGTVTVGNAHEGGAQFTVRLPLSPR
ncbi:sensor histidine kinase [Streptomyces sp. BE20]|uniref:sensor histidine kinase n=1 Tax=unclassified Streptomyces TaxID=2593676 RepID=UPI002E75CCFF|nr:MULTISPECIES: sensor histidine kinase [unclassified Streptomyces]MED7947539.1 sensor histidine kinase [Streptomyces sp. BE303]MEE1825216.1 sensor histidine kinase [Streptomyces sp. BE20]